MKKLQTWVLLFLGLGALPIITAFTPDNNKPAPGDQVFLLVNHRPVAERCVTASGRPYAIHNTCVFSAGSYCYPLDCPTDGPFYAANRKPIVVNCIINGRIVAYGNDCLIEQGSICIWNNCPE